MYADYETTISHKYLQQVIEVLAEPICLLGGWAVYFQVNKQYKKAQDRDYLGSRDIDLGFQLSNSTEQFAKALMVLEKQGFEPVSFRMLKQIHTETGKEITKDDNVPTPYIFPLYVDMMVDTIPKDFRKTFGFTPADEPLLKYVFEDKKYRTELTHVHTHLWMPSVVIMLAMKINALSNRSKEHKKIKDVADIFALLWYTDQENLGAQVQKIVPKLKIKKSLDTITPNIYQQAAQVLGHTEQELVRILNFLSD